MHVAEAAEGVAGQVCAVRAYVTDINHHVPRQLALNIEAPHVHHGIVRCREVELEIPAERGIAVRRQRQVIGRDRRVAQRGFVHGRITERKHHAILGERSTLLGIETLRVIEKHLPLRAGGDSLADIVEAIGSVGVENIEAAADDGLAVFRRGPGEIHAWTNAVLVRGRHVVTLGKLLVAPIDHFSRQARQLIRTAQTKVGHRALAVAGFEIAVDVVAHTDVESKTRRNSKVVLNVKSPVAPAIVGILRVRKP